MAPSSKARQIIKAQRASIKVIDDILTTFGNLRREMEEYEKKKNIATTVGTSTAALGTVGVLTGIGLAAFTGGTSLLLTWGAIAATVGGAGVNIGTSIVDNKESKKFFERIDQQLVCYNEALQELGRVWEDLNQVMDELKKQFDLDNNTAFSVALTLTTDGGKVCERVATCLSATALAQAATTIKTLEKLGTVTRSVGGGTKFVFSSLETAASLSTKQMNALTNIAKSDVALFTTTASKAVFQGALAAVSVVITLWEIKSLVDDWKGTHATIQAVDKVINELEKKKDSLQSIICILEKV